MLARLARLGARAAARRAPPPLHARAGQRLFSEYEGQNVTDDQLVKKSDDWAIEETNFCLGRTSFVRFKETDDLARRTKHLMDTQLAKQHTRLRDGTVIPYTALFLTDVLDKPGPVHIFTEQPLLKWTWDETYDEAYEKPDGAKVQRVHDFKALYDLDAIGDLDESARPAFKLGEIRRTPRSLDFRELEGVAQFQSEMQAQDFEAPALASRTSGV